MSGNPRTLDVALVVQAAVRGSGQGRPTVELAHEMVRRGHRVTIYAHEVEPTLAEQVTVRSVRRLRPRPLDDIWLLAAASVLVARSAHEVVWAVGPTCFAGRRRVFNAHMSHRGWQQSFRPGESTRLKHRVYAWLLRALEALVARRAHLVVVPSAVVATQLGLEHGDYSVVPNGVDAEEFAPPDAADRAAARNAFGIDPESVVVGFLGEFATTRKGLDPLLQAVAQGPEREVLLVTAPGPIELLHRRAAALGISARVVARGAGRSVTTYAASDVVAVPSAYDSFSLVALEAAASGLPVVISRAAGASAVLDGAALVVEDPGNVAELRGALDLLETDTAERRCMGERARARALELSWSASATRGVDLLEDLADRFPSQASLGPGR